MDTDRVSGSTRDKETGLLISRAEVAEVPYTAFTSKKGQQITGRLVVRRIPELGPTALREQPTLFDTWRFHAFFTAVPADKLDTVTVDQTHRHHAIIEQVNADLKAKASSHIFPRGSTRRTRPGWYSRSSRTIHPCCRRDRRPGRETRAVTQTIRRTLINVPARIARSARKLRLHLPECWPWARRC